MHALTSWVLGYLLNAIWQLPLLFAAAWCIVHLLRPAGARLHHRIWVGTLLLQCFLPACSSRFITRLQELVHGLWRRHGETHGMVSVEFGPGTAAGAMHLSASVYLAMTECYAAFLLYSILRFVWRSYRLHALRMEAQPILLSPACNSFWQACSHRFGVRHAHIAVCSGISGPLTIGTRRKLMLVPTAMLSSFNDNSLQAAMAHELAHMQRSDFANNLIHELLTLPLAWHPLLWATRAHVTETREMICDRMASQAVGGQLTYARSLLQLASHLAGTPPAVIPHAIGIFDAHQLERRIDMLTLPSAQLRGIRRITLVGLSLAVALTACGSALAMHLSVNGAAPAAGVKPASAANDTERVFRISPVVMATMILNRVQPIYPPEAKAAKIQGAVVLSAIIGKDGTVQQLTAIAGPEQLRQSALDAVHQWTYHPYLLNGQPEAVASSITVTYSFGE